MEQKNAPAQPQVTGLQRFNSYIANPNTQNYLQSLLKDKVSSFVSNLTAIVAQDDKLQACTPATLMYAAVKATGMGLPIDNSLGHVYVIPYNNTKKGITEAQLQIGYKGFKQLALRSGEFLLMNETDIRSGELLFNNYLTGEISFKFEQDPEVRKQLAIIGYVSYFKLRNGFESTLFMTVEELEEHAMRYSQSYRSTTKWVHDTSKWATDKDAMCRKTVCKLNLSRNAPLSIEMREALLSDQAIFREPDKPSYDDNPEEMPLDPDKAQKVMDKFKGYKMEEDAKIVSEEKL